MTVTDPDKTYRRAWAELIRAKRKDLGMTPAELARKLGVSRAAVANWEHQKWPPGPRSQRALIRELGITDNELARIYRGSAA